MSTSANLILHCSGLIHCDTCRADSADGKAFRDSILAFCGLSTVDHGAIECPYEMKIGAYREKLSWLRHMMNADRANPIAIDSVEDVLKSVAGITTNDEADRWIRSIVAQLQDEERRHIEKGETCKARRCREKIKARWQEYLQQKKQLTTNQHSAYTEADRGVANA